MRIKDINPDGNKIIIRVLKNKDVGEYIHGIQTVSLPRYEDKTIDFSNIAEIVKVPDHLSEEFSVGEYVVFTYTSGFVFLWNIKNYDEDDNLYAIASKDWILGKIESKRLQ